MNSTIERATKGTLPEKFSVLWETSIFLPDAVAFLDDYPNATRRERAAVLLVDQFYRWRSDCVVLAERYFVKFPDIAEDETLTLELIVQEFELQAKQTDISKRPKLVEFVARFPNLRQPLTRILAQKGHFERFPSYAEATQDITDAEAPTVTPRGKTDTTVDLSITTIDQSTHLVSHDTFSALPSEVLELLRTHMSEQTYRGGEYLMRQGETGTSLVLLCDGIVGISSDDKDGNRHFIARSGPGEVLGEMAMLTEEPRSANVVAEGDVRVLVLPADTFHKLAKEHPSITYVLTQLVATRLGGRARDALADKTLGGYEIKRRLGQGGMAIVYEASELESGRRVALKMMSHRLVYDEAALDLFQREADIIESFRHENIVRMHGRFDAFRTYFIVLEYCDGISLERIIRTYGPLPVGEFRKVIGQVAVAMSYAHDSDIVHRDIKPGNIMVNRDGIVKLMDFGLATPVDTGHRKKSDPIVGTPRYMAPEQLAGEAVGKESDYYALGCTAYKMLTGKSLFAETDIDELRRIHATWKTPSFDEFCPRVDNEVRELLIQALNRDRETRRVDLEKLSRWAGPVDQALFCDPDFDDSAEGWQSATVIE